MAATIEEIDKLLDKRLAPLKNIQRDIKKISKDQKIIVNFFDQEYLELRKRIERMEAHLHLAPIID